MKRKVEDEIKVDDSGEDSYDYGEDQVETGAPKVAGSKGGKIIFIAFFAILISVLLYFLFFNGNNKSKDNKDLSPVPVAEFSTSTPAPESSLDNIQDVFGKEGDDVAEDVILKTPELPAVPELPDIFSDSKSSLLPAFMDLPDDQKRSAQQKDSLGNLPPLPISPESANNQALVTQKPVAPVPSPIIVVAGGVGPTNSIGYENNIINLNADPIQSLEAREPEISAQFIKDRTTTLIQGKVLTAILETAIHTEFPGDVRAIISRNVYAESGDNILIPKGSRIYGSYSSQIARGQGRVTINWSRLIRPDGVDATISFVASDQFGRSGIEGDVDNKYGTIIGNSILTSILAVGGALIAEQLSGDATTSTTSNPATGTITSTGNASSQAIADVSKSIVETVGKAVGSNLNLSPIIRVPQGTKITILVNSDMSLPQFKK